jgi:hypothetical protein
MSAQLEMSLPEPDAFEVQLEKQWAKNRADQAAFWTEERKACAWAFGTIQMEETPWGGMAQYEQNTLVLMYRCERERASSFGADMRSAGYLEAMAEDAFRLNKALAEHWAEEIRVAFKRRQPCPIIPEPDFEWILDWAFLLAQVPSESLEPVAIP